jgi:hypothetical protein
MQCPPGQHADQMAFVIRRVAHIVDGSMLRAASAAMVAMDQT